MQQQEIKTKELVETFTTISRLADKSKELMFQLKHYEPFWTDKGMEEPFGDTYGDLQKAIVSMIRGSEIAFEELTGVKYHQDPEDTIPN